MEEQKELRTVYTTGFRNINNNIGFRTYSDDGELLRENKGFLSGSKILFVGESNLGKSTLCYNILCNSARKRIKEGKEVRIFLIDTESGTNKNRFRHLSNFTDKEINEHVSFEDDVSLENLMSIIDSEIERKRDKKAVLDKVINPSGEEVEIHYPTYIVVDAFSEVISRDLMEIGAKDPKNFSMRVGGDRNIFFKKYTSYFSRYNINLFMVSHIADNIEIGGMSGATPSRKFGGMSGNKKISGGKNLQYQSDIVFYLEKYAGVYNEKSAEAKKIDWLGTTHIIQTQIIKNRQAQPNINFYLVLDTDMGFNPLKSFIYECLATDIIKTVGGYRSLEGYEKKFRAAEIPELYQNNTDGFRDILNKAYNDRKENILESMKRDKEQMARVDAILDFMED